MTPQGQRQGLPAAPARAPPPSPPAPGPARLLPRLLPGRTGGRAWGLAGAWRLRPQEATGRNPAPLPQNASAEKQVGSAARGRSTAGGPFPSPTRLRSRRATCRAPGGRAGPRLYQARGGRRKKIKRREKRRIEEKREKKRKENRGKKRRERRRDEKGKEKKKNRKENRKEKKRKKKRRKRERRNCETLPRP